MKKIALLAVVAFAVLVQYVYACTRIVYHGLNGTVVTARSMDWDGEIPANLWVLPRGMERTGMVANNSVKWKAKYGSLVTTSWDACSVDGMNEKGLVANLLWLAESKYPTSQFTPGKKNLEICSWAQYVLDNFATVSEAVNEFKKDEIQILSGNLLGTDAVSTLHLSISDASGDNAIFEYIDGKLKIYHDKSYIAMTNSPSYDQQLALYKYWNAIPGDAFIPGSYKGSDRFTRASYYAKSIPKVDDPRIAIPSVLSVLRTTSVPFGINSEIEPDMSSTRWRTVADHKNLVYYFDNVLTPNLISVDLKKLDFSEKASVKKLSLENDESYVGETSALFKKATPFTFMSIKYAL
ncbi:linear amide C-N hydrolase [Chryseobacterium oryctis]|uniref:Linear amide C-N hydrolase n=1 Tax=Chryseobacterium oryctis TaxID=2952618 RepID=A0ABT3HSJ9_9FLAO|nr:linear amide C-N hydrolase [Chryseobacterium oryctis]MCW3162747.1 linear amide C-N hydrolase [Chryseobacterium oryctis]